MKITFTTKWYTPELLRENPRTLFVFGDNVEEWGKGGQAVIRDEPNSFGIPTKISPVEYFSEANWRGYKSIIDLKLEELQNLIELPDSVTPYNTITFPIDFIGTGLAGLPTECPSLLFYLYHRVNLLMHTVNNSSCVEVD
jgi:hypothetical protein